MPTVRPATVEDAQDLAPRLRQADVQECAAMSGNDPLQSLLTGVLEGTETLTIVGDDGEIIAMFGIHHLPEFGSDQACVWMMSSPSLIKIKSEFLRQTGDYLRFFHRQYALLWNLVDARNEVHIKWLKRVGFVFIKRHDNFGPQQRTFFEFVRIDPNV
jgi:hypothetical protein